MGFLSDIFATGTNSRPRPEEVFAPGHEGGFRFVEFIKRVAAEQEICLNAPTVDAWDAEQHLLEALSDVGGVGRDALNAAVTMYCNTHWVFAQCGRQWKQNVPLYYTWFKINGETQSGSTVNEFQLHLTRAYWESLHPEALVEWGRI